MAVKDEANNQDTTNSEFQDTGTDNNAQLGVSKAAFDLMTQQDLDKQKIQDELYAAIKRGDRVRVEELVDRGADVNTPDKNGTTAMMNAVENNDANMSREFLQQKANGNIAFDPTADVNLTGGTAAPVTPVDPATVPTDPDTTAPVTASPGQRDPNAPGADNTSSANVADAVAQGITAEEASANGNFALAAQLAAQEDLAQEALEQNDAASTDLSDGDMSYASTVAESQGGYYQDPYADYYGDDFGYDSYDPYDSYSMDSYNDPYGYDDPYGDEGYYEADGYDPYGDSEFAFNQPDPALTTPGSTFSLTDPTAGASTFNFTDPALTGTNSFDMSAPSISLNNSTFNLNDPALTSLNTDSLLTPSRGSSFFNFSQASLDTGSLLTPSTATPGGLASTSNFTDLTAPTTGGGQTVWNTQFFNPASLQGPATAANDLTVTTPAIAPTNPYYRPASGASSMTM